MGGGGVDGDLSPSAGGLIPSGVTVLKEYQGGSGSNIGRANCSREDSRWCSATSNTRKGSSNPGGELVFPGIDPSGVTSRLLLFIEGHLFVYSRGCLITHTGIHCYIAVRKQHLYAIDRYVSKRCNHKTQLKLKELKSLAWKDVDEKWFNELINKKEEKLLQNIERNNSINSTSSTSTSTSSSNNNNCERSLFLCTVILLSYILKTKVAPAWVACKRPSSG